MFIRIAFIVSAVTVIAAFAPRASALQPGAGLGSNRLCGHYSLSFSGEVVPAGKISGAGVVTADCGGRLFDGIETIIDSSGNLCEGKLAGTYSIDANGFGTASLSFVPNSPSLACPIVNFNEALSVGLSGNIVKAINTSG